MTKATETALLFVALATAYALLLTGTIPTSAKVQSEIVPLLPWWALVTFGAYSLGTLGYDVLTFNDKEEKYHELVKEIDEAKEFLQDKGVDVE